MDMTKTQIKKLANLQRRHRELTKQITTLARRISQAELVSMAHVVQAAEEFHARLDKEAAASAVGFAAKA